MWIVCSLSFFASIGTHFIFRLVSFFFYLWPNNKLFLNCVIDMNKNLFDFFSRLLIFRLKCENSFLRITDVICVRRTQFVYWVLRCCYYCCRQCVLGLYGIKNIYLFDRVHLLPCLVVGKEDTSRWGHLSRSAYLSAALCAYLEAQHRTSDRSRHCGNFGRLSQWLH